MEEQPEHAAKDTMDSAKKKRTRKNKNKNPPASRNEGQELNSAEMDSRDHHGNPHRNHRNSDSRGGGGRPFRGRNDQRGGRGQHGARGQGQRPSSGSYRRQYSGPGSPHPQEYGQSPPKVYGISGGPPPYPIGGGSYTPEIRRYRNTDSGGSIGTDEEAQNSPANRGRGGHRGRNGGCQGNNSPQGSRQGRNRQGNARRNNFNFEAYMSREDVSAGLKRGELIQGALRINPRNYEDAYLPHPDGVSDIYICGMKDRNRAFNTDIVVVKLYPREEWKVLTEDLDTEESILNKMSKLSIAGTPVKPTDCSTDKDKLDTGNQGSTGEKEPNQAPPGKSESEKGAGCETPKSASGGASDGCAGTPPRTPNDQKQGNSNQRRGTTGKKFTSLKNFVHPDNASVARRMLFGSQDAENTGSQAVEVPDRFLQRTGKIVYILERKHSRACTGYIKLMQDKNPNRALFAPLDHRVPRLIIPMADCPPDFHARPEDYSSTLFVARITDWEESSQMAKGTVARSLGEAGQIEPETEGILIENDVDYSEFSDEALACLPTDLPWRIPAEEQRTRKDLRKECIFTIDPATARDLDDALMVNHLGDGIYEVGVHIADVSYFLQEETELDSVAASRATSVYLVQKVIPMLPRLLCEQLCSLNPDEDRLTFSVIWKITEDGEIMDEWMGRSIIRSCVKLSYDHAQGFIEQPDREWTKEELPEISEGFTIEQIKERVLNLDKIARNLRKQRAENGALRLDQVKLQYTLDKASGLPSGYYVYQQRDSNKLVEEFMLLANMAVAHKIYGSAKTTALLRRHPPPQNKMLADLEEVCASIGVPIDTTDSLTLQRSIARYAGDDIEAQSMVQILTAMCAKPMQTAKYFCTGSLEEESLFRHYALNVPLYTHFTSPIRRFADVVVHRHLAAALGLAAPPAVTTQSVQRQAEHCNDKKDASKRVQDLSSDMFFSIFVKECGPLEEEGMVMAVLDRSFDVLVLKLGVVKRVYTEKLPLKEKSFRKDHKRPELTLVWETSAEHPREATQVIRIFTLVSCILTADEQPLKYSAVIKHPDDCKRDSQ